MILNSPWKSKSHRVLESKMLDFWGTRPSILEFRVLIAHPSQNLSVIHSRKFMLWKMRSFKMFIVFKIMYETKQVSNSLSLFFYSDFIFMNFNNILNLLQVPLVLPLKWSGLIVVTQMHATSAWRLNFNLEKKTLLVWIKSILTINAFLKETS